MNELNLRRRGILKSTKAPVLVDTSATSTAFYRRKSTAEKHVCGARANGKVKLWRDLNGGTGDFSAANYTSSGLNSTDYNNPWTDTAQAYRCKFGGSNVNPSTAASTVNLDSAYAYWKETGRIMFAGKNTPFYGMSNIDGTLAEPGWSG